MGWYGLALYYYALGYFGYTPPKQVNAQCNQAILKALELDETLPEAHVIVGVLRALDYDWRGAEREFLRALELDPLSVETWTQYDYNYLVPMRRLDEAITGTRKALERDPLSPVLQFRLGLWYFYTRQWDQAMEQARNALELSPHYWAPYSVMAGVYAGTGKPEGSIRSYETIVQLTGRSPFALGFLGFFNALAGHVGDAMKLIDELQELEQKIYVPPCSFAWIYMGLGEIDKALEWCEKAIDERDGWILHLGVFPGFDSLRSHPRYPALLRKMNLQP